MVPIKRLTHCPWCDESSHQLSSQIYLKLENLQPAGSFKSRGIGNFLRSSLIARGNNDTSNKQKLTHFFSSSGGNAGLGCVHAAVTLGSPATIVVPMNTTEYMKSKIRTAGATDVIQHGASWAEADQYLREVVFPKAEQKGESAVYVHPFDHPKVWEANATIVPEVVTN